MLRNAMGAVALLCVVTGPLWAETLDGGEPVTPAHLQQMQSELDSLRSQLNGVRASQNETWLNERRAQEVKSLVREVLADADMRASMVEGGSTAGHNGKNFFLANEDGSFLMNVSGQIQGRYVATFRRDSGADDGETGFVVRRAKVAFAGHIADPRIKYAIQLAVDPGSDIAIADKIVMSYDLTDNITIWAGEDKGPFLREELTNSNAQLAVERSYVNEIFTLDKVQGIGAIWEPTDSVKIHGMWNDGMRSGESGGGSNAFTQAMAFDAQTIATTQEGTVTKDFDGDRTDFAMTTRIDIRLMGDWNQMSDFTSWSGEEMALFVGGAFHWEVGETHDGAFNNDFYSWTIDASYENQGWSAFVAGVGQHTDQEDTAILGGATNFDQFGAIAQVAYNMDTGNGRSIEPFFRYEYIDFDSAITTTTFAGGNDVAHIITGGFNWYFAKHAAKFTADVVYALDPLPIGQSGLGLLSDANNEDGQVALRGQFQLLF